MVVVVEEVLGLVEMVVVELGKGGMVPTTALPLETSASVTSVATWRRLPMFTRDISRENLQYTAKMFTYQRVRNINLDGSCTVVKIQLAISFT